MRVYVTSYHVYIECHCGSKHEASATLKSWKRLWRLSTSNHKLYCRTVAQRSLRLSSSIHLHDAPILGSIPLSALGLSTPLLCQIRKDGDAAMAS